MSKNRLKKGFTIIELIVVIAILGILVLLAAPKFLGYTTDAKVANVKNDIAAYENAIEKERIDDDKYIKDWEKVDVVKMNSLKNSLFTKKGLITESNNIAFEGEYYKIPKGNELVKTSLKGDFYLGEGGEVYYYDEKLASKVNGGTTPSKPENPTDKDLGYSDSDFTWKEDSYGYIGVNGEKGYFQYTGKGRSTVEIPHVIQGVPTTSYYNMFYNSPVEVTKVISTNKNVTSMTAMFLGSKATSLDVSEFDTSNVTNMIQMFQNSQAQSITFGPNFNTSNVTNMKRMFYQSKATSLDLSKFNTSKVTNMSSMFDRSQAESLDLSSFDTSNITDMSWMFWESQAKIIKFGPKFNTSKVTNMYAMFYGSQAESLDLSSFNTSNVTDMTSMFFFSKATKGYAGTQEDADRFNASFNKPAALTFEVKNP